MCLSGLNNLLDYAMEGVTTEKVECGEVRSAALLDRAPAEEVGDV